MKLQDLADAYCRERREADTTHNRFVIASAIRSYAVHVGHEATTADLTRGSLAQFAKTHTAALRILQLWKYAALKGICPEPGITVPQVRIVYQKHRDATRELQQRTAAREARRGWRRWFAFK